MVWEVEMGSIVLERRRAFCSGELKYLLPEFYHNNGNEIRKVSYLLKDKLLIGYLSANSKWLVLHVGTCCQLHVSTT